MSTIYSNSPSSTINFTAAGSFVTWKGGKNKQGNNAPMLLQRLVFTYDRRVTPVYPINSTGSTDYKKIHLMGQPMGRMEWTGILTPDTKDLIDFLEIAGNSCVDEKHQLTIKITPFTACKQDDKIFTYTMKGVTLISVGLTIEGRDEVVIVSKPLTFLFSSLEMKNTGTNSSVSVGGTSRWGSVPPGGPGGPNFLAAPVI